MILSMALLKEISDLNGADATKKQSELFETLNYSEEFKKILRWMLTINPKNRPDFLELHKSLSKMTIE